MTRQHTGQTTLMTVRSEEGKIVSLGFTGTPVDRVAFQDDFFGRYPQFRKYTMGTSPLAASHAP